jgi:hypothetical protein
MNRQETIRMQMRSNIYERRLKINGECVVLRLFRRRRGFMLERRVDQMGAVVSTQVLPMKSESDLSDFAAADPYAGELSAIYQDIRRNLAAFHVESE